MFKKLLIIGCGLIGSSLLRASINKKISRQILVFEKSKKYKKQIKSINSKIIILDRLDKNISDVDFAILSTPMSEYKKIILEVRESNTVAQRLYKKYGFKQISKRKKYYVDEDAKVYQREKIYS